MESTASAIAHGHDYGGARWHTCSDRKQPRPDNALARNALSLPDNVSHATHERAVTALLPKRSSGVGDPHN
jgi:hypothetical protein